MCLTVLFHILGVNVFLFSGHFHFWLLCVLWYLVIITIYVCDGVKLNVWGQKFVSIYYTFHFKQVAVGPPGATGVVVAAHVEQEAGKQDTARAPAHPLRMAEKDVQDIRFRLGVAGIMSIVHKRVRSWSEFPNRTFFLKKGIIIHIFTELSHKNTLR